MDVKCGCQGLEAHCFPVIGDVALFLYRTAASDSLAEQPFTSENANICSSVCVLMHEKSNCICMNPEL